jgi:DNA-binding transcriptional ArsR family regulator
MHWDEMHSYDLLHQTFAALAEPTRIAVVGLLRDKPLRSGDIASALSVSRPAMSRHLRVLRRAGLVEEETLEEDSRGRVYRLRPEAFSQLRSWLDEVEAFWGDQLQAFKRHAERKSRKRRP